MATYNDLSTVETTNTGTTALNNSIRNIIMTPRGSLPSNPRFGSDIYKIVFAQLDGATETIAKNFIYEALREFENRIIVRDINFNNAPEYNKMVINIIYNYADGMEPAVGATNISVAY